MDETNVDEESARRFVQIIREGGTMVIAPNVVPAITAAGIDPSLWRVNAFIPDGYIVAVAPSALRPSFAPRTLDETALESV